jgi:hypothetical protein
VTRLYHPLLLVSLGACALAGPGARRNGADANESPSDAPSNIHIPDAPPPSGCAQAFTGVLATWSLAGATGSQTSSAATTTATGIVAGPLTRASTLNAASGSGSMNSSGWATTSTPDATKYYTFTITPPSGCKLALSSGAFDVAHSSTGPTLGAIATSSDNYVNQTTLSTSTASTPSLVVSGGTAQLEIRVYGYGASAGTGTMRIQNTLSLSGSLY